ncbi:MAG: hypothetical protein NZ761_13905, partial [Dehalococcoidia bacterium]|nr:hypothetical protein [Dehalococcoidia bacterium]
VDALAELDPTARTLVEALARVLRRGGTLDELLQLERAAVIEALSREELRAKAGTTLQALSAPRR